MRLHRFLRLRRWAGSPWCERWTAGACPAAQAHLFRGTFNDLTFVFIAVYAPHPSAGMQGGGAEVDIEGGFLLSEDHLLYAALQFADLRRRPTRGRALVMPPE